jgi:hypothetical protein
VGGLNLLVRNTREKEGEDAVLPREQRERRKRCGGGIPGLLLLTCLRPTLDDSEQVDQQQRVRALQHILILQEREHTRGVLAELWLEKVREPSAQFVLDVRQRLLYHF